MVTYNGVDGACAAAMALLRFPSAEVVVSSAASIGHTLGSLGDQPRPPAEIHVCGVGVRGAWKELSQRAEALRKRGATIHWYCGRGYLDDEQARFSEVCSPVFLDASSNTEAVCRHLNLSDHPQAPFLLGLAQHDPGVDTAEKKPTREDQFWLDLVAASTAEYFKYRDRERYGTTVHKLSKQQSDESDRRLVDVFRRAGFRHALSGRSALVQQLREIIKKCAAVDQPVLITGESGVGKEHVAHLIHERGARATEPFIPVNCAIFAGNVGLANSVLFGHRQGAFTGATADRQGAFVAAAGGVLFLDELGELPLEVQAKLLRVVEDRAIIPEGADRPTCEADVQLIAATGRDLPAMIRRGAFRADLFYRLSSLRISVPPLRERPDDLDEIIDETLGDLAEEGRPRKLTKQERKQLHAYDWPGNVRQLIQVLKRTVYLELRLQDAIAEERRLGPLVSCDDAGADCGLLPSSKDEILPMEEVRRRYAQQALSLCGGNLQATARALGIAVNTLRSWLAKG